MTRQPMRLARRSSKSGAWLYPSTPATANRPRRPQALRRTPLPEGCPHPRPRPGSLPGRPHLSHGRHRHRHRTGAHDILYLIERLRLGVPIELVDEHHSTEEGPPPVLCCESAPWLAPPHPPGPPNSAPPPRRLRRRHPRRALPSAPAPTQTAVYRLFLLIPSLSPRIFDRPTSTAGATTPTRAPVRGPATAEQSARSAARGIDPAQPRS